MLNKVTKYFEWAIKRERIRFVNSVTNIREAKEFINRLLWVRKNIPF